ncbi:MAG: DUF2617 family protein [Candidatus Buchananbacteria bacterium]|nr:DUF2617 family protein [Candidatus Buchananbacteria bacterium]
MTRMSQIDFVYQTVDVLNLNLFELKTAKQIYKDMDLTIMKSQEFKFQERRVCLAIIGESHFIWIEGLMLELLACTELGNNLPIETYLDRKVQGHNLNGLAYLRDFGPLRYTIGVNFAPYTPDPFKDLPQTEQNKVCLMESFPFNHNGKNLACWTRLQLIEDYNRLLLFTSHAYPPDYIVLTHSTFTFI